MKFKHGDRVVIKPNHGLTIHVGVVGTILTSSSGRSYSTTGSSATDESYYVLFDVEIGHLHPSRIYSVDYTGDANNRPFLYYEYELDYSKEYYRDLKLVEVLNEV